MDKETYEAINMLSDLVQKAFIKLEELEKRIEKLEGVNK